MIYKIKVSVKVRKIIYKVVMLQQNLYGINITFSVVSIFELQKYSSL